MGGGAVGAGTMGVGSRCGYGDWKAGVASGWDGWLSGYLLAARRCFDGDGGDEDGLLRTSMYNDRVHALHSSWR